MIFIVLGSQKFQLNRLLEIMDRYVGQGLIQEDVFAQIGNSSYEPKHYRYVRFLDKLKFEEKMQAADIVITHSGVGSIISGINAGKKVIVYPRLVKYREHVDNHQLDIASAFEKKGYVICCYEEQDLLECIARSETFHYQKYISQREQIVSIITNYIEQEKGRKVNDKS